MFVTVPVLTVTAAGAVVILLGVVNAEPGLPFAANGVTVNVYAWLGYKPVKVPPDAPNSCGVLEVAVGLDTTEYDVILTTIGHTNATLVLVTVPYVTVVTAAGVVVILAVGGDVPPLPDALTDVTVNV